MSASPSPTRLRRQVGLPGAVLLGLGSMVGTGVFVALGLGAGIAGSAVLLALALAAALAMANGLSSAQLAAAHPVSGGTYEYGYRWLGPAFGFAAGWMFLWAKSASAATAALGLVGYLRGFVPSLAAVPTSVAAATLTLAITALVAGGVRRSNRGNAALVGITLLGLLALVAASATGAVGGGTGAAAGGTGAAAQGIGPARQAAGVLAAPGEVGIGALLHAAALLFVAFTGYGRVATLGEEVREPDRVIPRAVVATVLAVTVVYAAVAIAALRVLGAEGFAAATTSTAAPLDAVARALAVPHLPALVTLAAVTAMAGVLLNLVLGLSRVLLAMGRRGDAPSAVARIDDARSSPVVAVWCCGLWIAGLTFLGDVRTTWSFSAFTVLVYYAITNAAALRLDESRRRFPRWIAALALVGCLGLGVQVEARTWAAGLGLLAVGLLGRAVARRARRT
jgi:APA family basic amino acid/polyamine antiporter